MRLLLRPLTTALSPRRALSHTTATLRPHAPVLRLAVLFALAFLLAFYLDARAANAHRPSAPGVEASVTPTAPAHRLPAGSAR